MSDRMYLDGYVYEPVDLESLSKEDLIEIIEDMSWIIEEYSDEEDDKDITVGMTEEEIDEEVAKIMENFRFISS